MRDANGSTGATIGAAHDTTAINYLITLYAEIETVAACGVPVKVGPDAIADETKVIQSALSKLGP